MGFLPFDHSYDMIKIMEQLKEIWNQLDAIRDLVMENPRKARKAADSALALLAQLQAAPLELRAFAHQIDGTAWRALGKHEAAELAYKKAEGIYRRTLVTCEDLALRRRLVLGQADLRRRWAILCLERKEWGRGLAMLDTAENCFTLANQPYDLGRVYLVRGQLHWERRQAGDQDRALELLAWAVEMIDPGQREAAFRAAEHNLTAALSLHPNPSPESLERAFKALQRGRLSKASKRPGAHGRRRQLLGHCETTAPDAKRRYLQGKIQLLLMQHDEARPFLETARKDLMLLANYPRDVFAITLDLAECYLGLFRRPWRRIADLLTETFKLCPVSDINPEAEAAVELLQTALAAQSFPQVEKQLAAVRETMR